MFDVKELEDFGMAKTSGAEAVYHLMKKTLLEFDDGNVEIALTQMRNIPELALLLPNGDTVYLWLDSIEELKAFEKSIAGWEPYC